ncbi:MAG: hypothetical protein LAT82_02495 [Nanoarchaeota archaeon]|nr:hypothetical protein [Nanoarchaeota archaeon]
MNLDNSISTNSNFKYIDKLVNTTHLGKKASKNFVLNHYNSKNFKNKGNNYVETSFKVIHVTGTAGKGTISKMIAKGLEDAGFKVGLFTSPHMLRVNERIQINSCNIDSKELEVLLEKYYKLYPNIMFCEILVLVAIDYFTQKRVDYAVFEVFVGGEFDTTNIFNSVACVITSIGLDHQHLLGETYEEILTQKLGIIRKNVPLFTRIEHKVIGSKVQEIGAIYNKVETLCDTNLKGEFQRKNAGIAYEVLKYLGVKDMSTRNSLMNILIRGRIEHIKSNIIVDCAHNELALRELKLYLEEKLFQINQDLNYLKKTLIFAISNYKELKEFKFFFEMFDTIIFTKSTIFKAKDLKEEYLAFEDSLKNKSIFLDIEKVYNYLEKIENNEFCVVTGSVFLVADVLKYFEYTR